jgi:alanine-alpha-ketoisovalerate/valine-pyruvate aminotransferase
MLFVPGRQAIVDADDHWVRSIRISSATDMDTIRKGIARLDDFVRSRLV